MLSDYEGKRYAAAYKGNCLVQCISAEATPAMLSIILPFVCIILIHNQDDCDDKSICF